MPNKNEVPHEDGIDHTLSFLREGYLYIPNRRLSFHSDIFETRLLGKKAICMGGKQAAEVFYDTEKFKRMGATPKRVVQSFFGNNSVQTLDGDAHKHRKDMLMSIMSDDSLQKLTDIANAQWENALDQWGQMDKVILYEEVKELMCRIACQWAGVPLQEEEVKSRTKDLAALFESAAAVGPAYWAGRNARNRVDQWIGELIDGVRSGEVNAPENTAFHIFSWHRDLDGKLLDTETAAVEIVNILRPIVAIAIFINFLALALHHHPQEREKLQPAEEKQTLMFIQETRRFYPFFPLIVALVKEDFSWGSYAFKKGTLTLLDLYGTNHDPNMWGNPDVFHPERFADWEGSPFGFIPQGGGDYWLGHRCAGEWVTLEMMKVSVDYLAKRMDYEVPDQDLSFSRVSIPSIPHSKVVIKNVKRRV